MRTLIAVALVAAFFCTNASAQLKHQPRDPGLSDNELTPLNPREIEIRREARQRKYFWPTHKAVSEKAQVFEGHEFVPYLEGDVPAPLLEARKAHEVVRRQHDGAYRTYAFHKMDRMAWFSDQIIPVEVDGKMLYGLICLPEIGCVYIHEALNYVSLYIELNSGDDERVTEALREIYVLGHEQGLVDMNPTTPADLLPTRPDGVYQAYPRSTPGVRRPPMDDENQHVYPPEHPPEHPSGAVNDPSSGVTVSPEGGGGTIDYEHARPIPLPEAKSPTVPGTPGILPGARPDQPPGE